MKKKPKQDFKELKAKWYKKLKKSGFEDIEYESGELKFSSTISNKRRQERAAIWQDRADYYTLAGWFLNDYKFTVELEKIIWEYHSNGMSAREITETLRKAKIKKTNRTTVWATIKSLQQLMKQKYIKGNNEIGH